MRIEETGLRSCAAGRVRVVESDPGLRSCAAGRARVVESDPGRQVPGWKEEERIDVVVPDRV